jgi:UDP-N-acetylmuramate: L-alanyl-gamma-D-glutamyl-meso-diaminopimelate ligase
MKNMRVHFIAIGGAVMHNLAIALHKKGYIVTGSDDEIFEPSKTRLAGYGLLPEKEGWYPDNINRNIDTVILGMHAKEDNPELIRSRELGLNIMSFPEYLYDQTKDKKRIVIGGSHGKTTTTAMIMHVFKTRGIKFDYMVGSSIDGYETMVGLSHESETAIFEGDEYLSSTLDKRPKFHLYKPDIAVLNGIAWDHVNVFPTFYFYLEQFRIFVDKISEGGTLIYFKDDNEVKKIALGSRPDITKIPYSVHSYLQDKAGFHAVTPARSVTLNIFGAHNMQNLSAAREACLAAGIGENDFYNAIASFEGTAKRLQKLVEKDNTVVYLDFGHAPSKVRATVDAIAERYAGRKIIVCYELHTYSSLNADFLYQYKDTLAHADLALVYFNPHAIQLKRLAPISTTMVKKAFGGDNIEVFDDSIELFNKVAELKSNNSVLLLMSSGDFNGKDINKIAEEFTV